MSILKTSLAVESSTVFSTPITMSSNNDNVVTGSSSYGRCFVTESTNHYLTLAEAGAMGDYLYVQSAITNPKHTAIEIYGKDDLVLARLFAGDSGFITVSSESGKIYAKTTHGDATLDFIIGSRGEELGKSAIIYNIDGEENWRYFLMDAGTGKPTELKNTGYKISEWNFNRESVVTDNGYVFYMLNISDNGNSRYLLIDKMGNAVLNNLPVNGAIDQHYELYSKGYAWTWSDGPIWYVSVFDGNNYYYHEIPDVFDSAPYIDYSMGTSLSASDGSFVIYFRTGDGATDTEVSYLINKEMKHKLSEIDYNIDGYYAENITYAYGGIHAQLIYTDDAQVYTGLRIFNNNGTLLKTLDWGTGAQLRNREIHFYGNGKLFILFYNQSDLNIPYQMFQYNLNTGVLIGEDMQWKHQRGSTYRYWNVTRYTYDFFSATDANLQSMMIDFYNSTNQVSGWNNKESAYLDTYAILDNETTYQFQRFADDQTIYFSEYNDVTDKSVIRSYTNNNSTGVSFWYFFLPDGERKTVQLISNNSLVSDISRVLGRNYVQLHYRINSGADNVYKMYTLDGTLKDTLSYSNSEAGSDWWGDSFIHVDYANSQSWWFDVTKGKYSKSAHFIEDWESAYAGTTSSGLGRETIVLLSIGYFGVIDKGVLLAYKSIYSMFPNISNGESYRVLKDTVQFVYFKGLSPYYTIAIFDFNLNLLYEVETKTNRSTTENIDNRIIYQLWDVADDQKIDYVCPGKLISYKQITHDGNAQSANHISINNRSW